MSASFPQRLRHLESLNGLWDFHFSETPITPHHATFSDKMLVPQCFDATPAYYSKHGYGLYRKTVTIPPQQKAQLHFEGSGQLTTVWVDGKLVGSNDCSYTPFKCAIPPSTQETREIWVLTSNRHDPALTPLHEPYYDFYQWSGIMRPVWLEYLADIHLEHVQIIPLDPEAGKVRIDLIWKGITDGALPIELQFDRAPSISLTTEIHNSTSSITTSVPNPKPWTSESPNLHTLHLCTKQDDVVIRFGLRLITVKNREILLNGKPLRLIGFNRHEAMMGGGHTVTPSQMLNDLQLIRGLGCNFIRGSHYPQTQQFLDLCDELGIFVWEEMFGWQQHQSHFLDESFRKSHARGVESMIRASINHPSVIMWGFLNEADSHIPESRPLFESIVSQIRSLDPSRPITFASHKLAQDINLDLIDIVSFNTYPGWYNAGTNPEPLSMIEPRLLELAAIRNTRPDLKDKPLILSEIGVESLYGVRDESLPYYSENFQAAYIDQVMKTYFACGEYAGLCFWHFSDARTYQNGPSIMRPQGFNNKGLYNEFRQPKMACANIREKLKSD